MNGNLLHVGQRLAYDEDRQRLIIAAQVRLGGMVAKRNCLEFQRTDGRLNEVEPGVGRWGLVLQRGAEHDATVARRVLMG